MSTYSDLQAQVGALVGALRDRNSTVATAESLTAGLLSAAIADIPGASAVLRGGLVVYATDLKISLARVSEETIADHGPVSAQTARELAEGAARVCGSDWGVGCTGVAGPDMQDGHPVGTVFVGVSGAGSTTVASLSLLGDRRTVRRDTVLAAVSELLRRVSE